MRFSSRTWFLLSLLFFVAAVFFWLLGNRYIGNKNRPYPPAKSQGANSTLPLAPSQFPLLTQLPANPPGPAQPSPADPGGSSASTTTNASKRAFPHRLGNTSKPLNELARMDSAIVLRNALIDTALPLTLHIPEHLRSPRDSGSYLVQAHGPINDEFRARLREVDATIVSYIPNNAFLIRLSAEKANRLSAFRETQAVLPYEPYYKLDTQLLALAVEQKSLPPESWLRLTLFPGERDAALQALKPLGAEVISEEPSPFGPQLLVRPNRDSLVALAQLPAVQGIEPYHQRGLLNDGTRVVLGVSTDGVTNANYLGLSGNNILVNINDSALDGSHPDLQGRVTTASSISLTDSIGHGTHVAGIIAGNGSQSTSITKTPDGSPTNANFRGMAPQARLFFLPLDFSPGVNEPVTDTYLQRTAARTNLAQRRTGPIISNNSWWNVGANEYDSSSARFDAAVRDALPDQTSSQSILFVFPSGNSGGGSDDGLGGNPNSIASPANAKNVITVGSTDHLRFITNSFEITLADGTVITNVPFLGLTDSDEEVSYFSGRGNVGVGIEGTFGRFKPDVVAPGSFVISTASAGWTLGPEFDPNGPLAKVLNDLNGPLLPAYRYQTGSSMAAAAVSGTLALMQEFFEQRLPINLRRTNSAAMMKALLINGARSLGSIYDFQVQNSVNIQGWGRVNLTNSVPEMLATQPEGNWPIRFFDQNPTNAVATGQTKSWEVTLSTNAQRLPFRATLVWTDPPGNPNAGIKLVNDLDLVVSNTVTHQIYYGNDIAISSDFNQVNETNSTPVRDVINNVENVFLREALGSNFVVSVIGRRVNVTSATDYQQATGLGNDVVQDYALVLSIGDLTLTNELKVLPVLTNAPPAIPPPLIAMTNGVPLLNQRVGAQPTTALNARHGLPPQWNFFVFTNIYVTNEFSSMTNGTNVAFITFLPPNLSRARNLQSDIDLYVSKDARLTNLEPSVVDASTKSITRLGTEFVVFTNAAIGDIFYIGVKAEDQQAAEYGLIGLSSDDPFDQDDDGKRILRGFPVRAIIPDGSAETPGSVQVFAIGILPNLVQRVTVTNVISHGNLGDLIGILSHDRNSVVLNNHTLLGNIFGTNIFIYDDSTFGPPPFSQRPDGPGTLNDFAGSPGQGVWMLSMVDNSLSHTGRVESLVLRVEPMLGGDLLAAGDAGLNGSVGPNGVISYFVDVPPEATNLTVEVTQMTGPLDLYVQRESLPTTNSFDKKLLLTPPGGTLTLGIGDPNPIRSGRYFVLLYNPDPFNTVTFHIRTRLDLSLALDSGRTLSMTNLLALLDEGTISSSLHVPVDKELSNVQVGVRINHPRAADLALHLVSPQGTRILLAENRGGISSFGYGAGYDTNITYTVFTEDTNRFAGLELMKFATPPFTNRLGGSNAPPIFFDGFEKSPPGEYGSNSFVSGWQVTRGKVTVHGATNSLGILAATGTNFVELDVQRTPAALLTSFSTTPGTDYMLSFDFHRNPAAPPRTAHALQLYYGPPLDSRPARKFIAAPDFGWASTDIVFRATSPITALELSSLTSAGPLVDSVEIFEIIATTNSYVLPEEALDLLKGERSIGEWKLEITDNRRGPGTGLPPALLSWQLQLKYADPRPKSVILQDKIVYSGTLTNNQTNYFVVDVCANTTVAVSTLTGPFSRLNFLADRSGLPTGDTLTDDFVPQINSRTNNAATNAGIAELMLNLNTSHPAPLEPGKRHFLAVHNLNPDETNSYTIQVSVDRDDCHAFRPLIRLTNAVPHTNVIEVSSELLDNYVFNVSTNAIGVNFDLFPVDGDLTLVLRHDFPPPPNLGLYDYISDNPGITNELIFVKTNSSPVALLPGDWFVSVFNKESIPVSYRIRATELSTAGLNIIPLTNGVPRDFEIKSGSPLTNYFWFPVTNQFPLLIFSLTNLNGPAELLTGLNRLPPGEGTTTNAASPTAPLELKIQPSGVGDYYLAVRSTGTNTNDLRFTIRAQLISDLGSTNLVFIDPRVEIGTNNICFFWPSLAGREYRLEAKTNIQDSAWLAASPLLIGNGSTNSVCLDFPTQLHFFRIVLYPTVVAPPPSQFIDPTLTITRTNLCLAWASLVGTNYFVEAKSNIQDTAWVRISPQITAVNTQTQYCLDLPTPYRFFQIAVVGGTPPPPPPPPPSQFIDPTIALTRTNLCLTWASLVGTNYFVEAKTNVQDSTWLRISPQITATSTNSRYCLDLPTPYRFFQIAVVGGTAPPPPPPPPSQFIDPTLAITQTNLCLTWVSLVGTNYFVEAKTNIQDLVWLRISPQITATTTNSRYCLDLPSPYRFFRIAVIAGAPAPAAIIPRPTLSSTNLCLDWPSEAGVRYRLEGRANGATNVVYDNTVTNTAVRSYFAGNGLEFGDQVTLDRAERLIKTFRFDYFLSTNANLNEMAELFIRANDGTNGAPGTNVLYRSGEFPLDGGYQVVEASELDLIVPRTFTWSVVITGIETNRGEQVGLLFNSPPKVGSSSISFWSKATNGVWSNPLDTNGSFSAFITATAETGTNWTAFDSVTATTNRTTYCLDLPTAFQSFRIFTDTAGGSGTTTTNAPALKAPVVLAGGRLQFTWDTVIGQTYELQQTPNLVPPPPVNWITVTNLTATSTSVTVTDPTPATNSMRFYRLIRR
jgi:subtilisin family serine protease